MDLNDFELDAAAHLAQLAAALRTSRRFPLAAAAGERLATRFGVPLNPVGSAATLSIDELLAEAARRYATPVPEAYLSEWIAQRQDKRRQQGAYYTPWPLARYLMRSAAETVRSEFPGAATTWLDPACGGGVFFSAQDAEREEAAAARLAWDASPVAVALAEAIREARGGRAVQFQCLDALQQSPASIARGPLVIVGNPPYSNFGQRRISPWLQAELAAYRSPRGERKTHLRDACILFLRLAQSLVEQAGAGLIAMVLSTTFLDALTHARLRASLAESFDELRILRLDAAETPAIDNLFAIRQTTAACLFLRRSGAAPVRRAAIYEAALQGDRSEKLAWLENHTSTTTPWRAVDPSWGEGTKANAAADAPGWYAAAPALTEVFREHVSGVQTKEDALFLARCRAALRAQIVDRFGEFDPALVQTILVGPFDPWWIYYDPRRLGRARYRVMQHMLQENLALVFMRQATTRGEYDHILAVRQMTTDRIFHSRWGAPFLAPRELWEGSRRSSNLVVGNPDEWLAYAYALLHTRWYREGAASALRRDFPRLPARSFFAPEVAAELIALGNALLELHAPAAGWRAREDADEIPSDFQVDRRAPRAVASGLALRVETAPGKAILECPAAVWAYRIGGVEVLKRFLMRRRGTRLMEWEIAHLRQVALILQTTLELRQRLDALELSKS